MMDIGTFLKKNSAFSGEVILFGASFLGRTFAYKLLTTAGINIDYYCDNNTNLQGKVINGIEVASTQRIIERRNDVFIFVGVGAEKADDIEKQLLGYGVPAERVVRVDYLLMQEIVEYVTASEDKDLIRQWDDFIDDEKYLKWRFKDYLGYELNLKEPRTFNEKLQWLKLHDRRSEYSLLVDKYLVKEYVANTIGEEYVIPTLGVWEKFEDIDFGLLPNQFVLKCTHDSGSVVICRDKSTFDIEAARKKLTYCLKKNLYYAFREWPYKNVSPRIIAEEYISSDYPGRNLNVYKVLNFAGESKLLQVIQDDKTMHETIDYFDTDWTLMDLRQNYPNSRLHLEKPKKLDEILGLSKKLSRNFPFIRVDFYYVNDRVVFSEFTLYSDAGVAPFHPNDWDSILGNIICIKHIRGGGVLLNLTDNIVYIHQEYKEHKYELRDYKFLLFHGVVKMMYIATDRQSKEETKFDFFDREFYHLNICNGHPNTQQMLKKPAGYEKMVYLAEKLGKNIAHVRVDFYESDRDILFGEMTLYHMSGMTPYEPQSWDYQIGSWLDI